MVTATLLPAYGRKYTNKAQVEADWKAGNDFRLLAVGVNQQNCYANRADLNGIVNAVKVYYDNSYTRFHYFKV